MAVFEQAFLGFQNEGLVGRSPHASALSLFALSSLARNAVGMPCIVAALGIMGLSAVPNMAYADGFEGLGILLDAGYSYDNNLTNASNPADKRSDSALHLNLDANKAVALSEHTRVVLSGFIESQAFATYGGLDSLSGDVEAEYMYRPSGEFMAPTFGLVASVGRDEFKSDLRKNDHYAPGITLRQPVTDRIHVYAALKDNISRSDNAVFNTRDTSTQLNVDYGFATGKTLYLTGEYRDGDIVSTSQPSLAYREIAVAFINDDVFASGQPLRDYRIKGKTAVARLGYNLSLAGKKSLDISWRYVRSTSDSRPDQASSAIKYVGNQFSIVYLMGF